MSNFKKVFSNTFWQVLSRFIQALIGVVSLKLLTEIFPADVYGQYVTLFEYIGFFAIAADFGLYTVCISEMSKNTEEKEEIFANLLFLRVVLTVFILGFASFITPKIGIYENTLIAKGIYIVSLMTGITLLSGTLSSVLQFELKMHKAALAQLFSKVVYIFGVIYLWKISLNGSNINKFDFLLDLNLLSSLVLLFFTFIYVRKYISFSFKVSKKYSLNLIKKALPYGIAIMLNKFYFKIDVLMIQAMKGNFEAATYSIPIKIMEILNLIPVFFMNSCLPFLGKTFKNSKEKFQNIIKGSFKSLFIVVCPVLMCGYFLAYPLTASLSNSQFLSGYHCVNDARRIFQQEELAINECENLEKSDFAIIENQNTYVYYEGSDYAFKIILFALFFAFLNVVFNYYLLASDNQKTLLKFNFTALGLNVVLNYLFIPIYGFMAASLVTVVCEALILFLGLNYYLKNHKLNIRFDFYLKISALSLFLGFLCKYLYEFSFIYMKNFNLLLIIPVIVALYFGLIYRFKLTNLDDLKNYFKTS